MQKRRGTRSKEGEDAAAATKELWIEASCVCLWLLRRKQMLEKSAKVAESYVMVGNM